MPLLLFLQPASAGCPQTSAGAARDSVVDRLWGAVGWFGQVGTMSRLCWKNLEKIKHIIPKRPSGRSKINIFLSKTRMCFVALVTFRGCLVVCSGFSTFGGCKWLFWVWTTQQKVFYYQKNWSNRFQAKESNIKTYFSRETMEKQHVTVGTGTTLKLLCRWSLAIGGYFPLS